MRGSAFWAAAGAALIVIVATEAAAARGIADNNDGAGSDVHRQVPQIKKGRG